MYFEDVYRFVTTEADGGIEWKYTLPVFCGVRISPENQLSNYKLTDVKLLWVCVERAYKMMCGISTHLSEHRLRTKSNDVEKANLSYRKQRKHAHKQLNMLEIITRVYLQQKNHFKSGDTRESIPNRIVSLSKPHIRPIVRGKENKIVTSFTLKGRTGKNEIKNATKREFSESHSDERLIRHP